MEGFGHDALLNRGETSAVAVLSTPSCSSTRKQELALAVTPMTLLVLAAAAVAEVATVVAATVLAAVVAATVVAATLSWPSSDSTVRLLRR